MHGRRDARLYSIHLAPRHPNIRDCQVIRWPVQIGRESCERICTCAHSVLTFWQDFPDGLQRREAFLSKLVAFFKARSKSAEEWDVALFRLAFSSTNIKNNFLSNHSVQCWHISRSVQCTCLDALMRYFSLEVYQEDLRNSALFQHANSRPLPDIQGDIARDSLVVLKFFLSLSETSPRAAELSSFIPA